MQFVDEEIVCILFCPTVINKNVVNFVREGL